MTADTKPVAEGRRRPGGFAFEDQPPATPQPTTGPGQPAPGAGDPWPRHRRLAGGRSPTQSWHWWCARRGPQSSG